MEQQQTTEAREQGAAGDAPAEHAPEQQSPPVPEPPVTGDPAVDAALRDLALAAAAPLETQLAGYEETHRVLQDRLADVEG